MSAAKTCRTVAHDLQGDQARKRDWVLAAERRGAQRLLTSEGSAAARRWLDGCNRGRPRHPPNFGEPVAEQKMSRGPPDVRHRPRRIIVRKIVGGKADGFPCLAVAKELFPQGLGVVLQVVEHANGAIGAVFDE